MESATQVQILDEADCVSCHSNVLEKGPNLSLLTQLSVNNRVSWLFNLGKTTSLGEWKVWIQTSCTLLKNIHLVSILMVERLDKYTHLFLALHEIENLN